MKHVALLLPDDLGDWAEERAAEARLGGAGECLADLLRRDRDDAQKLARLQAAIDEGRASLVVETTIKEIIARAARPGTASREPQAPRRRRARP